MKKFLAAVTCFTLLISSTIAEAVLIDRGCGLIYDTDRNITWLQDVNHALTSAHPAADSLGRMVWDDAVEWADSLEYCGYDDWRLPTAYNQDGTGPDLGFNTTSEMAHLYYDYGITFSTPGPFGNLPSSNPTYWTGTSASTNNAYAVWLSTGEQVSDGKGGTHTTGGYNYAWAVRDGDVGPSPAYTVIDLGNDKYVFAVNNQGQVVGFRFAPNDHVLFIYENELFFDLASIGYNGKPRDINHSGQIVGDLSYSSGDSSAFLYENGTLSDLGKFGGIASYAYAINDQGQVAVTAYMGDNVHNAFIYQNGGVTPLDMIGGNTSAFGINNLGHVVGFVTLGGAYLYENGDMRLIGTFPDRTRHNNTRDINDCDQVIGFYDNGTTYVSFLWENENTTFLPLFYEIDTRPSAINNLGQIVGTGAGSNGDVSGVLWDNGLIYDLNELIPFGSGWVIIEAVDINDAGQIVGRGILNGEEHAILLSPLPTDADGDGIPDGEDACPNSNLSPTVEIDGCDSGVENFCFDNGCTISDNIAECASGVTNHGDFVSAVTHYTTDLKKDGFISGKEKGAIQSCAGQAGILKPLTYEVLLSYYTDEDEKTWIEITLVDRDGNPVPYEHFELTLPGGTVVEGDLDSNGNASSEITGAVPGNYQISFPDLDKEEWIKI